MEMKFTASVVMAVQAMIELQQGWLRVWLPGQENEYGVSDSRTPLPPPCWCNFAFFRRIRALPIQRKKRVEPVLGKEVAYRDQRLGYWEVEREVHFWHGTTLVGKVTLRGEKCDGPLNGRGDDDKTMWAITKIAYMTGDRNNGWLEYELMPTGTTLMSHMDDTVVKQN